MAFQFKKKKNRRNDVTVILEDSEVMPPPKNRFRDNPVVTFRTQREADPSVTIDMPRKWKSNVLTHRPKDLTTSVDKRIQISQPGPSTKSNDEETRVEIRPRNRLFEALGPFRKVAGEIPSHEPPIAQSKGQIVFKDLVVKPKVVKSNPFLASAEEKKQKKTEEEKNVSIRVNMVLFIQQKEELSTLQEAKVKRSLINPILPPGVDKPSGQKSADPVVSTAQKDIDKSAQSTPTLTVLRPSGFHRKPVTAYESDRKQKDDPHSAPPLAVSTTIDTAPTSDTSIAQILSSEDTEEEMLRIFPQKATYDRSKMTDSDRHKMEKEILATRKRRSEQDPRSTTALPPHLLQPMKRKPIEGPTPSTSVAYVEVKASHVKENLAKTPEKHPPPEKKPLSSRKSIAERISRIQREKKEEQQREELKDEQKIQEDEEKNERTDVHDEKKGKHNERSPLLRRRHEKEEGKDSVSKKEMEKSNFDVGKKHEKHKHHHRSPDRRIKHAEHKNLGEDDRHERRKASKEREFAHGRQKEKREFGREHSKKYGREIKERSRQKDSDEVNPRRKDSSSLENAPPKVSFISPKVLLGRNGREKILPFFTNKYVFSNHFPCPGMEINGKTFCCSEQYYMWRKAKFSKNEAAAAAILMSTDPKQMKLIGSSLDKFDEREWKKVSWKYMLEANLAKYEQFEILRFQLFRTLGGILVEASPTDKWWGVGLGLESEHLADRSKWNGENIMGDILMEVRDLLMERRTFKEEVRRAKRCLIAEGN